MVVNVEKKTGVLVYCCYLSAIKYTLVLTGETHSNMLYKSIWDELIFILLWRIKSSIGRDDTYRYITNRSWIDQNSFSRKCYSDSHLILQFLINNTSLQKILFLLFWTRQSVSYIDFWIPQAKFHQQVSEIIEV